MKFFGVNRAEQSKSCRDHCFGKVSIQNLSVIIDGQRRTPERRCLSLLSDFDGCKVTDIRWLVTFWKGM
jgi:hypothetical protein